MFEVPFFDSNISFEARLSDCALNIELEVKPEPKKATIRVDNIIISNGMDPETFKTMLARALAT